MDSKVFTLHRYFIWANAMRTQLDLIFKNMNQSGTEEITKDLPEMISIFMYMSMWYGMLYVVVEGWRELGLSDPVIDELLASPNVDFLRKYRNSAFHYQPEYLNAKQSEFLKSEFKPVEWVRKLNSEFGRYFIDSFKG